MRAKKALNNVGETIWLPLKDEPFGKITICMLGIIITTVLVFVWQYFTQVDVQEQYWFSMSTFYTRPWTLFTYFFMHYPPQLNLYLAIAHIAGNMWFLFLFMNNLEEKIGYWVLPFYIVGGIVSGLVFGIVFPDTLIVGASGAVSAIMGAYYVAFPHNKLTLIGVPQGSLENIKGLEDLMGLKDKILYKTVSCKYWLWSWFIVQIPLCLSTSNNGVAYLCHVSGFIFGMLAVVMFKWYKHRGGGEDVVVAVPG